MLVFAIVAIYVLGVICCEAYLHNYTRKTGIHGSSEDYILCFLSWFGLVILWALLGDDDTTDETEE